jgi:hypothetical protein
MLSAREMSIGTKTLYQDGLNFTSPKHEQPNEAAVLMMAKPIA